MSDKSLEKILLNAVLILNGRSSYNQGASDPGVVWWTVAPYFSCCGKENKSLLKLLIIN